MRNIQTLLDIMQTLRNPQSGCPWDIEQTFATIAPYTLEEAYEVVDAIEQNDMAGLREELGDLLLQVVFHAQMAKEQGDFEFADVVEAICSKMMRRHPHVFGDDDRVVTKADVRRTWQKIKQQESETKRSVLDGIPRALPALKRAQKMGSRAASLGFDWPDPRGAMAKVDEELAEFRAATESGCPGQIEAEMGDLLFSLVNVCRHHGIDAEAALDGTVAKFRRRFAAVEQAIESAEDALGLEAMETIWQNAKSAEPDTGP